MNVVIKRSLKTSGFDEQHSDCVWIAVCRGPPILQIAVAILAHLARDSNASPSVGYTRGEVVNAAGLVATRQPTLVVISAAWIVILDVLIVSKCQFFDSCRNNTKTAQK